MKKLNIKFGGDMKKKKDIDVKFIIYIVLFCTYIFPTGIFFKENYAAPKLIFMISVFFMYIMEIISKGKIGKKELLFNISAVILTFFSQNINFMLFIILPYMNRMLKKKEKIIEITKNTNMLYICLAFTFLYSLYFRGSQDSRGRLAFTAIKEINQSGLAIFCLGCLLMSKNKFMGKLTLLFGCLTFSRSYFLAIICLILNKMLKFIKKDSFNFLISKTTYLTLTIVSSIVLILLGNFYIIQYKAGNIVSEANMTSRLLNFLDYSNFFRFQAIIVLLKCFQNYPSTILLGMSNEDYLELGRNISKKMDLPFRGTPPHNLFFSHLKIYGFMSIIETCYVSLILKKIVNRNNYGIYLAIVLYSIFLGAGLYSYWLYLTIFSLLVYDKGEDDEKVKL